ncbi:hypothetical protein GW915_10860 [bacterium]|nr:hypothetical protein [bacterium]
MAFSITDWIPRLNTRTLKNKQYQTLRLAAVDVGSNAIRILIVDTTTKGSFVEVFSKRFSLRLGSEAFSGHGFSPATFTNFLGVFEKIRSYLDYYEVDFHRTVATSAMRNAKNAPRAISEIAKKFSIKINIISGEKEAETILEAVKNLPKLTKDLTIMDLGGGSLEILHARNQKMKAFATLPLGAVRSLDYYQDCPEKLEERITSVIEKNAKLLSNFAQDTNQTKLLLGTGGNIRSLNKLANRIINGKINKKTMTRDQLCIVLDRLSELNLKQRQRELELPPDRADVILPAAHVFYEFMFYFGFKSIYVPKVSLKHGIIAKLIEDKALL